MQQQLFHFFESYPHLAILISLAISVLIAVLGLIPSVFITGANILFFGFWPGILLSFAGEAIGALVAFILYRKGFKRSVGNSLSKFPKAQKLVEAEGKDAFGLIVSMRLLPFVPSGLVTFAAAIGKVSTLLFFLASSIGKAPALMLEGFSVYQVTQFGVAGKIILFIVAIVLLVFVVRHILKKK